MPGTVPKLKILDEVARALKAGTRPLAEVAGPWGSAKTLLAVQCAEALGCPLFIVAAGRIEAEAIHDDLCTFAGEDNTVLFPAWEVLPSDTMDPADDIIAERMNTLKRLAESGAHAPHTVLPLRALMQYVVRPKRLGAGTITLKTGEDHDMDALLATLVKIGYRRDIMVEHRGDISVRGGILDIFPISSELPCRIEFFGDEIESIRRFEPETQRSIDTLDEIKVLPRSEKLLLAGEAKEEGPLADITRYLPKDALVVLDEPVAIAEQGNQLDEDFANSRYHMNWDTAQAALGRFRRLAISQVGGAGPEGAKQHFHLPTRSARSYAGATEDFWEQLKKWDLDKKSVRLYCVNSGERRRLFELLEEQGYQPGRDAFDLRVELGRLRGGFEAGPLVVLSEREIFGRHYVRRKRRRFEAGTAITQFSDLKSGDYVVHAQHGIGRYTGLRRFQGKAGDFMIIQYAKGDTMYVPATRVDEVQKYSAGDGALPKVDRLGGSTWNKKKAKVKESVRKLTIDLVKLYAAREQARGHAFSPDTPWQVEFEDAFEYDETPDQARAIEDTKRDMESARPMDRLLCGDVGYGKTEVALRAAFKAVMDRKQVALLAPTTVLAQQHFSTFCERLADYPIRIELLNRFRSPKQQRETIAKMKSGEADIVIGTHRLVSKDVIFKDLGLLVIDEEQRFGVKHKERLKEVRTHVDVLTMTATPIPRTLHFSLIGVRDMSAINTAPNDRLPIHTCIEHWDDNLIREALHRELGRQGQAFFLHNRVQTIEKTAAHLQKLVPNARIGVGHGQMEKHELEDIMTRFIEREIDVLVCTTIIGSGIDIPNANTIIVDRADNFGLAELYQIRGRVGRYKHRAFAYLLIPSDRALSEEAQQRLKALEDFSELGSGFRIAMRDLEIRGCGNILGGEQSGSISAVGYETYKDLIAEAVAEERGEPVRRMNLPPFDVTVDAYIPEDYIAAPQQKMTLYRRIAAVKTPEEVDELAVELKDRFGRPPAPVRRLLDVMRVRAAAAGQGISSMVAGQRHLGLEFESARFLSEDLQHALRREFGGALQVTWKDKPGLQLAIEHGNDPVSLAQHLMDFIAEAG